jgi:hypothetical protein
MGIADATTGHNIQKAGQYGHAYIAVQKGHGTSVHLGPEPRPHHKVVTLPEEVNELGDLAEVVGPIGIRHDNIAPSGLFEATEIGIPVPTPVLMDDTRAGFLCYLR